MESRMWRCTLWVCVGEGSERGQCHCVASAVLSRRRFSTSAHPDARHFSFSPCWRPERVSLCKSWVHCGPFKRKLLRIPEFLLPPQPSLVFYIQKLWRLIFLALEPWAGGAWCGMGSLAPEVSLHHTGGTAHAVSPYLCTSSHLYLPHPAGWMWLL